MTVFTYRHTSACEHTHTCVHARVHIDAQCSREAKHLLFPDEPVSSKPFSQMSCSKNGEQISHTKGFRDVRWDWRPLSDRGKMINYPMYSIPSKPRNVGLRCTQRHTSHLGRAEEPDFRVLHMCSRVQPADTSDFKFHSANVLVVCLWVYSSAPPDPCLKNVLTNLTESTYL